MKTFCYFPFYSATEAFEPNASYLDNNINYWFLNQFPNCHNIYNVLLYLEGMGCATGVSALQECD